MSPKSKKVTDRFEQAVVALRRYTWSHEKRFINGTSYSRSQLDILAIIAEGLTITTKGLAEILFVSSGSITQTVESLVKKQLVEKIRDTDDRRILKLTITKAGREVADAYREGLRVQIGQALELLTDKEVNVLLGVLDKIAFAAKEQDRSMEK